MPRHIKTIAGLLLSGSLLFGFDYKLTPKQVSPSVWCFFGALEAPSKTNGGFMSNSCYVQTKESFVVIDSGPTYQFAQQSFGAMQKIAKLPVSTVINTHYHDDHWLGNSFYKTQQHAKILSTVLQKNTYKKGDTVRIQKMTSPEIFARTTIVTPDQTITQKTTLTIGGKRFTIIPVGTKAHTPEDFFVLLQDEKVLFSGDLVMNGRITSNRDGSVLGQLKAHKMINATDWKTLIPGHGFITNKHALEESNLYFSLLKKRVGKVVEDDIGADEITKTVTLPEFKDKAMYDIVNKRNIFDAYGELEFAE